MMDEEGRSKDRAGRRAMRLLTPLQKYDIYLQLVRGVDRVRGARGGRRVIRC